MYLENNTESARAMRKNIARLMQSENPENRAMAFEMIKTGGMPLEVLIDVYGLYFNSWSRSNEDVRRDVLLADSVLKTALPDRIFQRIKDYIASIDSNHDPRYFLFRGPDFFELLIEEKVADLPRLVQCWQDSPAFLAHTDLTLFLLHHLDAIDKNIFIDSRLGKAQLNHATMKALFETNDPHFDKPAFVAQYVSDGLLDLSRTRISQIPEECLVLEGIEKLHLHGTQVKDIPWNLLRNLKEISGSAHTLRAIKRQVMAMEDKNFYYAFSLLMEKAALDIAGNNLAEALKKLSAIPFDIVHTTFSKSEKSQYWERYFDTAIRLGEIELAMRLLENVLRSEEGALTVFRWKRLNDYMLQWTLDGTIDQWQALVAPYRNQNQYARQLFSLENQHFWIHAFRVTVSQKRFVDARRVLEMAIHHAGTNFLHRFPWYLYFKHLHECSDTEAILAMLAQYPGPVWQMYRFWSPWKDRIGDISRIWIEAALKQGDSDLAETLCANLISQFHQLTAAERNPMSASFLHIQQNAVDAYRYLAKIYAADRPVCAQYFQELAQKYQICLSGTLPVGSSCRPEWRHCVAMPEWSGDISSV